MKGIELHVVLRPKRHPNTVQLIKVQRKTARLKWSDFEMDSIIRVIHRAVQLSNKDSRYSQWRRQLLQRNRANCRA